MNVNIHTVNAPVNRKSTAIDSATVGRLDDQARARLTAWIAGRGMTRTEFGEGVGRNQSWASRYLEGEFAADLDTLARAAALFQQPISALFDATPDPDEAEALTRWRGLPPERKALMLGLLRDLVPDAAPRAQRGGRPRAPKPVPSDGAG
jgi:transcriptional regulator with XRE-family HTH domain